MLSKGQRDIPAALFDGYKCTPMKFGKVADLSTVDFRMPAPPSSNQSLVQKFRRPTDAPLHFYIGATGWSMPQWKSKWYPPKTKTSEMLAAYARQFNTIELNTTHYRIPTADQVATWYRDTPADFRFCPKIPQRISHARDLGQATDDLSHFVNSISGLQEKLGCCFIQLPPYFDATRLPLLESWLKLWPRDIALAVEVRHSSWFASESASEGLFEVLERFHTAAVITDVAGRRDVLHLRLTAPHTMIRFVGNGLVTSDYERIDQWVHLLSEWRWPEVYFFPHEPDNVLAPEMAVYLVEQLHTLPGATVRGPAPPDGRQTSLF